MGIIKKVFPKGVKGEETDLDAISAETNIHQLATLHALGKVMEVVSSENQIGQFLQKATALRASELKKAKEFKTLVEDK